MISEVLLMRISLLIVIVLLYSCRGLDYRAGQSRKNITALIQALDRESDITKRWLIAGDYYQKLQKTGAPVIENGRVHFFFWDEKGVLIPSIVGPFNYWRAGELPLKRLKGTPLLTASLPYRAYQDIVYLIAVGATWRIDPLCKSCIAGKTGRLASLFSPVRSEWPSWAWRHTDRNSRLRIAKLKSRFFRNSRKFLLYIPHGLKPEQSWTLLVVQNGFQETMLPLYKNIFDNLYSRNGDPQTVLIILPVLDPSRELPLRSIDYLDMVKYDLSRFLEKQGWSPAGAEKRKLLMSGRGGGFLLLAMLKGLKYFTDLLLVEPDDSKHRALIRYFSRFRRPGLLKASRLLWINSTGRAECHFKYVLEGLRRNGLPAVSYRTLSRTNLSGKKSRVAVLRAQVNYALSWK